MKLDRTVSYAECCPIKQLHSKWDYGSVKEKDLTLEFLSILPALFELSFEASQPLEILVPEKLPGAMLVKI